MWSVHACNDMNAPRYFQYLLFCKPTIKEGHDLASGAGAGGAELPVSGAAGDTLLHRPSYGLRIVRIGGHIGEIRCASLGTASQFPEIGHDHSTGAVGLSGKIVS